MTHQFPLLFSAIDVGPRRLKNRICCSAHAECLADDGMPTERMLRYELGNFAKQALEIGVNYIDGCCGCQGSHIRQVARALGKVPDEEREWAADYQNPQSATEAYKQLREQGDSP